MNIAQGQCHPRSGALGGADHVNPEADGIKRLTRRREGGRGKEKKITTEHTEHTEKEGEKGQAQVNCPCIVTSSCVYCGGIRILPRHAYFFPSP